MLFEYIEDNIVFTCGLILMLSLIKSQYGSSFSPGFIRIPGGSHKPVQLDISLSMNFSKKMPRQINIIWRGGCTIILLSDGAFPLKNIKWKL